jgi:hypothetical protein
MPRTKEEILSEIEEDKARVREIDATYAGQYLDPDSDPGKEWAERNARIDEQERTVEQIEKRERRITELAGKPENREEGVSFHTAPRARPRRGHLRPDHGPVERDRPAAAGQGDARARTAFRRGRADQRDRPVR